MTRVRYWVLAGLIALVCAAMAVLLLRPGTTTDLSRTQGSTSGGDKVTIPAAAFDPHIVEISAGADHTLALGDDGRVFAWGNNTDGQLGDGTTIPRSQPIRVDTSGTPMDGAHITQVSAGDYYSLALAEDGRVFSWGGNGFGTLGDGTQYDRPRPVEVRTGDADITQITAGPEHALALTRDGKLYGWGKGFEGRLGPAADFATTDPVSIPAPAPMTHVAASGNLSTALGGNGELYAWGVVLADRDSDYHILPVPEPTRIAPDLAGLARIIRVGDGYGTALLTDEGTLLEGTIRVSAEHEDGEGGHTITGGSFDVDHSREFLDLAAGDQYTLRLAPSGHVFASGTDNLGGLGFATEERVRDPRTGIDEPTVIPDLENIAAIDAGVNHSVALTRTGSVLTWGVPTTYYRAEATGDKKHRPEVVEFPGEKTVTEVFFGEASAGEFSIDRRGGITARTPAHERGEADVRIVFEDGSQTVLAGAFTYTD